MANIYDIIDDYTIIKTPNLTPDAHEYEEDFLIYPQGETEPSGQNIYKKIYIANYNTTTESIIGNFTKQQIKFDIDYLNGETGWCEANYDVVNSDPQNTTAYLQYSVEKNLNPNKRSCRIYLKVGAYKSTNYVTVIQNGTNYGDYYYNDRRTKKFEWTTINSNTYIAKIDNIMTRIMQLEPMQPTGTTYLTFNFGSKETQQFVENEADNFNLTLNSISNAAPGYTDEYFLRQFEILYVEQGQTKYYKLCSKSEYNWPYGLIYNVSITYTNDDNINYILNFDIKTKAIDKFIYIFHLKISESDLGTSQIKMQLKTNGIYVLGPVNLAPFTDITNSSSDVWLWYDTAVTYAPEDIQSLDLFTNFINKVNVRNCSYTKSETTGYVIYEIPADICNQILYG